MYYGTDAGVDLAPVSISSQNDAWPAVHVLTILNEDLLNTLLGSSNGLTAKPKPNVILTW